MEKEEQLFRKRVLELAELCFHRDMPSNTDFLNLNEQTIFQSISGTLPPVRYVLAGGFPGAERKVVCFLPSYEEELEDPPFECLRISARNKKFSGELTHRDFLLRYRQVLRAGGEIHFKTDNVGLFAFSVTEFPLGGFYPEQVTHDLHAQGIQGIMTDYEEKFHNMGTKINRCVAVKGDLPPQPVLEANTPEA